MINCGYIAKQNIKEGNPILLQIPDNLNRLLIIWAYGSRIPNSLFNLINHQPDIDKIYLYAKDPYQAKYQLLVNKKRKYRLQVFQWFQRFYWIRFYDIDDSCKNIEKLESKKIAKLFWRYGCWFA